MSTMMYVIRELEDGMDDCESTCESVECNSDDTESWDEAWAFYTGTAEGVRGEGQGYLGHQFADDMCTDFKTCGEDGWSTEGTANVNYKVLTKWMLGVGLLHSGSCESARSSLDDIIQRFQIPRIQGILKYAYRLDNLESTSDEDRAMGASLALSLIPHLHDCDDRAAEVLYGHMIVQKKPSFKVVKPVLENQYECMQVECKQIGGYYNRNTSSYFPGAEPCGFTTDVDSSSTLHFGFFLPSILTSILLMKLS